MMHTDLVFDKKYLDNILKSKINNIIGVKKANKSKLKEKSFVAQVNKKMKINSIEFNEKTSKPYGELICINKFSIEITGKIFKFMSDYFKSHGTSLTWEFIINDFIKDNKNKVYTLKNQIYKWVNVNTNNDLILAKKLFKKNKNLK